MPRVQGGRDIGRDPAVAGAPERHATAAVLNAEDPAPVTTCLILVEDAEISLRPGPDVDPRLNRQGAVGLNRIKDVVVRDDRVRGAVEVEAAVVGAAFEHLQIEVVRGQAGIGQGHVHLQARAGRRLAQGIRVPRILRRQQATRRETKGPGTRPRGQHVRLRVEIVVLLLEVQPTRQLQPQSVIAHLMLRVDANPIRARRGDAVSVKRRDPIGATVERLQVGAGRIGQPETRPGVADSSLHPRADDVTQFAFERPFIRLRGPHAVEGVLHQGLVQL